MPGPAQSGKTVNYSAAAVAHLLQAGSCRCRGASKRGQEVSGPIGAEEVPEGGLSCVTHLNVCHRLQCSIAQDEQRC